jgi:hypothetical protein
MNEHEAQTLAEAIARDAKHSPEPVYPSADKPGPVRVVDCVLSLRRNYEAVVLPRVERFHAEHPRTTTMADLIRVIEEAGGPESFARSALRIDSPAKGWTILGVAQYLDTMQLQFRGVDELARLEAWANWAHPGDYVMADIPGFGLAGFQYLRMLFGADTSKPDVRIIRYVSNAVGREVTDIQALYLLMRASQISGESLRRLDGFLWDLGDKA